ncbi:rRNA processing protein [Elasticomyces elasticus]|nr:rRNA processing protein [Elasticomyces elasticus]
MGSSAKRKKEKKQDFQKPKLKVGKTKPKAANFTSTSFKAKSIVLTQSTLSTTAPSLDAQILHNVSLFKSKSDSQRKDALAFITNAIMEHRKGFPYQVGEIFKEACKLLLDRSDGVRNELLKLLTQLPAVEVTIHIAEPLLRIRAGMTSLAKGIRFTSYDALIWLLKSNGEEVVSSVGTWVKYLQSFQSAFAFHAKDPAIATNTSGWSTLPSSVQPIGSNDSKVLMKQIQALESFLRAGLIQTGEDSEVLAAQSAARSFPLWHTEYHTMPTRSKPFARLNLFGPPRSAEDEMYDDVDERRRVFAELGLYRTFAHGIKTLRKQGGEVGRAASQVEKVLAEGMVDWDEDKEYEVAF